MTTPTTSNAARPDPAAFWNINLAHDKHTIKCPDYLQYCFQNEKDKGIIGTPDSEYHRLTWDEVKEYAARNRPDMFQRVPSELRKYRHFCHQLQGQYGSLIDFIMKARLQWSDTAASASYFSDPANYKILFNDWPYGVDERIVHLVVWTKFELLEDAMTGSLIPQMQAKVDDFVEEQFEKPCGEHNVAWFRNWASLKSVHAVEHFHVMIFEPDIAFISRLTDGDEPLAWKLGYIVR